MTYLRSAESLFALRAYQMHHSGRIMHRRRWVYPNGYNCPHIYYKRHLSSVVERESEELRVGGAIPSGAIYMRGGVGAVCTSL